MTREAVLAENAPGGFAGVYPVLKAMEEAGKVRRGYFVAGLGAAQFAMPGAVDRLRSLRGRQVGRDADGEEGPQVVTLAAADPAQPYGAALPWPASAGRPSRAAGAFVVLVDGVAGRVPRARGAELLTFGAPADRWADAIVGLVKDGRLRRIELLRIDGEPVADHVELHRLRAAGFIDGYRGLTARG